MLVPYQVSLVPNFLVSKWLGILNTRAAIILPGIFSTFSVFLLTKYMRRIPKSLIEAAELDGASEWQIFTKVCIPLCKSATRVRRSWYSLITGIWLNSRLSCCLTVINTHCRFSCQRSIREKSDWRLRLRLFIWYQPY